MIYIWGTGRICHDLIMGHNVDLELVDGFIETEKSVDVFKGKKVYSLDEIEEYDSIIVAIKNTDSIYNLCIKYNFDLSKICFIYANLLENNKEKNLNIARKILTEKGYKMVCDNYGKPDTIWIEEDAKQYSRLNDRKSFEIISKYNYYISADKNKSAGTIDSYFWQDLWAAKKISKEKPRVHYDIGSRVDGFIAHVLATGIKVCLIDIRPLDNIFIDNLDFICSDATNLEGIKDNSIDSISALCSLEHFGLGRYGDPIDPEACFKCFEAIQKKVRANGDIYISVPIGKEHIEFNAHRVFYAKTIVNCFDKCDLVEFSSAKIEEYEENIDIAKYDEDASIGGNRFGLFHFKKK